jgi:hypothetical protein
MDSRAEIKEEFIQRRKKLIFLTLVCLQRMFNVELKMQGAELMKDPVDYDLHTN